MFVFVTFLVIYIESMSVDMLYSYSNVVHLFSFFLNSGTEYASHVNWFCHKSFCLVYFSLFFIIHLVNINDHINDHII